jgi:hypothetical protein
MRPDMAKVIVERPRRAGYVTKGYGRVRDIEDLPRNQGMTRPHRMNWGGKELNENLAPLRRFLQSRVGHKWDDVYSEISENLKVTSAVQQHVRDHVSDFVTTRVSVDENGVLWGTRWGSPYRIGEGYGSRGELYVDPQDGILKRVAPEPRLPSYQQRREAQFADRVRVIDDSHELRKHKGIWYVCEVQCVPPGTWKHVVMADEQVRRVWTQTPCWDVLLHRFVDYGERDNMRNTYCVSKHQLNNKELKHHGVQND